MEPRREKSSSLMIVRLLEWAFAICSCLKLAVVLILTLAAVLALATLYEARYGTAAARAMVYSRGAFMGVMAMLAINVMAAAVARFPWKRKQTGFVITHCGIEILLFGCLVSFHRSIDGRV